MAGETTSLAVGSYKNANYVPTKGESGTLHVHTVTATYTNTNQLENTDVMEVAYLPEGMTIYQVIVTATDMDTNGAPTLAQKITIGSTDVVTAINDGRAATTTVYPLAAPYTTAAYDLLKVINTAAAATGATGSLTIRLFYTTA